MKHIKNELLIETLNFTLGWRYSPLAVCGECGEFTSPEGSASVLIMIRRHL